MKFTRNTVNGINDTILASNDYTAIPFTVTETAQKKDRITKVTTVKVP